MANADGYSLTIIYSSSPIQRKSARRSTQSRLLIIVTSSTCFLIFLPTLDCQYRYAKVQVCAANSGPRNWTSTNISASLSISAAKDLTSGSSNDELLNRNIRVAYIFGEKEKFLRFEWKLTIPGVRYRRMSGALRFCGWSLNLFLGCQHFHRRIWVQPPWADKWPFCLCSN